MSIHGKVRKKMLTVLLLSVFFAILSTSFDSMAEDDLFSTTEDGSNEDKKTDESEPVFPEEPQYDVTKPVIENVVFQQQGTILEKNDIVRLEVYAYDEKSGIQEINVYVKSDGGNSEQRMDVFYDEQRDVYICEYTLTDISVGRIYISGIQAVDKRGNYTDWETDSFVDGGFVNKYWASVNQQAEAPVSIKKLDFKQNGQTVNEKDMLEFSLETEGVDSGEVVLYFENEDGAIWNILLSRDGASPGLYRTKCSITSYYSEGKWLLKQVCAKLGAFGKETELQMENKEHYGFALKKTAASSGDQEAPVIHSVNLEKNGEKLHAGDSIEITVRATDNTALLQNGYVYFNAVSDIVNSTKTVCISYDETDKMYHGIFAVTEETYPCEWYIGRIEIGDTAQNYADDALYTRDAQYPYYVYIQNTNTFVSPAYQVNIDFLVLNEDGYWITYYQIEKKNVDRRSSLEEAGITFPETMFEYSDFVQIGWGDYNGNDITEDMRIIGNTYISVYAIYNQNRAAIEYCYPNEKGKWETKSRPFYVGRGETYGDLIARARAYIPENISKKYSFEGWDYDIGYYMEDQVISEYNLSFKFTAKVTKKAPDSIEPAEPGSADTPEDNPSQDINDAVDKRKPDPDSYPVSANGSGTASKKRPNAAEAFKYNTKEPAGIPNSADIILDGGTGSQPAAEGSGTMQLAANDNQSRTKSVNTGDSITEIFMMAMCGILSLAIMGCLKRVRPKPE